MNNAMEKKIIYKARIMKKILIISFLFISVIFSSCMSSSKQVYKNEVNTYHKFAEELSAVKDPKQYKSLLQKEIEHFQDIPDDNKEMKNLKASILKLCYERLFVIEDILGNTYQADIYFRKAEYWELIFMECGGDLVTTKEVAEHSKITKKGIRKFIKNIDPGFIKGIESFKKVNNSKKML